jgi:hypothetical protein
VPLAIIPSLLTILILLFSAGATIYSGWMWMRAPDELAGRPFWIIGIAGLSVFSALRGSPAGAAAWGAALILAGAALFLFSAQQIWLNRLLAGGAWIISALPFSLTATGWNGSGGILDFGLPVFLVAQALLIAGFVRHAMRPSARASLRSQPAWTRSVYPAGILLLLLIPLLLGLWGWQGAMQVGTLFPGAAASLLALVLLWAVPRFRVLNPVPAHWLQPSQDSPFEGLFDSLPALYRWLGGFSQTVSDVLEGEAGLMWTLLFLVLFIVLIVRRTP